MGYDIGVIMSHPFEAFLEVLIDEKRDKFRRLLVEIYE
jgi:hypothetical protein